LEQLLILHGGRRGTKKGKKEKKKQKRNAPGDHLDFLHWGRKEGGRSCSSCLPLSIEGGKGDWGAWGREKMKDVNAFPGRKGKRGGGNFFH